MAKVCSFGQQKRQGTKELKKFVETVETNTDRSINEITEIEHSTGRRNYVTMTIKTDGTNKKFIVDAVSPVTKIPPDKEIIIGKKKITVTRKYQDVNKNEAEF